MHIVRKLAPTGFIRISHYEQRTSCLGPGDRFALWLQGCERNCEGCIAPRMKSTEGGECIQIDTLCEQILTDTETSGLTISGGEPMYQADRLCTLLDLIRAHNRDLGVIVYTGYKIEELMASQDEAIQGLLHRTDILIDGAYIKALDDDLGLRGSSNQRAIMLTQRYEREAEIYEHPVGRRYDIKLSGDQLRFTGIPSFAAKKLLQLMTE